LHGNKTTKKPKRPPYSLRWQRKITKDEVLSTDREKIERWKKSSKVEKGDSHR